MIDDEEVPADAYYERLNTAIMSSAANDEIVTKWTVVVEVLDGDGDKGLWAMSDEHSSVWDTLGMLAFAEQKVRGRVDMVTWAQTSISVDDEDEDDE